MLEWLISAEVQCECSLDSVCRYAAKHDSRSVLEWAIERGTILTSNHLGWAAINGHIALVRWMHEKHHVPFGYELGEEVALTGNLAMLQYVVGKGVKLTCITSMCAAQSGSETMVRWIHDKRGKWSRLEISNVCAGAAAGGHLSLLQSLRSQGYIWDERTTDEAVTHGHVSVLRWAIENGCPFKCDYIVIESCLNMAKDGHLDMLKFLYQYDPKCFDDDVLDEVMEAAMCLGNLSMVQFLCSVHTWDEEVLMEAAQCTKPCALEMVQWLVEHDHFSLPLKDRFEMRLDVAKYLEEKGLLNTEEEKEEKAQYLVEMESVAKIEKELARLVNFL